MRDVPVTSLRAASSVEDVWTGGPSRSWLRLSKRRDVKAKKLRASSCFLFFFLLGAGIREVDKTRRGIKHFRGRTDVSQKRTDSMALSRRIIQFLLGGLQPREFEFQIREITGV